MADHHLNADQIAFLSALESCESKGKGRELTYGEISDLVDGNLPEAIRNALLQTLSQSKDNRLELARAILEGSRTTNSLPANLRTSSYALPVESAIIGRTREISEIRSLLNNEERYVNLVGSSGIGKSRLARAVARKGERKYSGVYYFSGQACQSVRDLRSAIALALGSPLLDDGCPVPVTLRALFIIDGAIRKPELAAFCEQLIGGTLHLSIICTSRVSIGAGRTYTVKPLDCDSSPGDESESVSLLMSIARQARQRAFGLGAEQLAVVARRVGGIPLALSLAAGCLASQSFADFESGFSRAARSAFVVSDRSTTEIPLKQILMHSFSSLSQHERNVLRCVSVLEGEFSLDEAVIVGAPVKTSPEDIEHLAGLGFIEQSEPGHKLFRIHDAILEFLTRSERSIDEMLIQSEAQLAHFGLFATRAQELGALMTQGKWDTGVGAIFSNTPNFRKATKYASNHDEPEQIAKLADGLARTYLEAGFLNDFEALTRIASISARKSRNMGLLARMLGLQGALASRRSQAQECERLWQERLEIGKITGDVFTACDALTDLAWHAFEQSELDQSLLYLSEAEVLAKKAMVPELVATAQVIRARISYAMGQTELATLHLQTCEETIKGCSNRDLLMFVYQALTSAYEEVSNVAMAQRSCLKLLSEAAAGHRAILIGWALRRLAPMFEQSGQLALAGQGLVAAEKVHGEYDTKHRDLATLALSNFESRFGQELAVELADAKLASWPTLVQTILDKAFRQQSRNTT